MLLAPSSPGTVVRAGVCVIGAGAAGITIARELGRAGVDTVLLEAGGREPTEAGTDAYRGTATSSVGRTPDAYLHQTRLRYFGGTTNHWAGWCHPLEPVELAPRAGVPHTGWPLDRATLDPWYAAAAGVLEIGSFDPPPPVRPHRPLPFRTDTSVVSRVYRMSPPTRFAGRYGEEILGHPHIRLALDAPAVDLLLDGEAVGAVEIAGPTGRWRVAADRFVLAAGGIENARILLSCTGRPDGLGNGNDLVGRFFADHPEVKPAGRLVVTDPGRRIERRLGHYLAPDGEPPDRTFAHLATTAAFQQANGTLGAVFGLVEAEGTPDPKVEAVADAAAAFEALGGVRHHTWLGEVHLHLEPAPNPESRVTLGTDRDALGMRRVKLDWRLSEVDTRTFRRSVAALARELGAVGLGRVRVLFDPSWRFMGGGCHHMGTTRMAADASEGVVDTNCRVFGVPNLHVAGSSVFPTYGAANPTLTLVALALRLADHLVRTP